MTCACTTGSNENGWHEQRCDYCVAEEMAEWRLLMEMTSTEQWRTFIARQRDEAYLRQMIEDSSQNDL